MKRTKAASSPKGRLSFLPTPKGREYFDQLGERLTEERVFVGVFDTGNSPLRAIRRAVGIDGSVFAPETEELAAA